MSLSRSLRFGLALVLGAGLAAGCATMDQPAATTVRYDDGGELGDASYFYDALSPYGHWMELSPYGLVWMPDGLGPGWSPYSQGFWTYSDYGWTWVDREPWGWAPFHYGRWWLDPQYAWVWIPGTEWAPAWVAWREGDAYVAWAPLPPTIHWSFTVPLHSGGTAVDALPLTWWNVARPAEMFDSGLRDRLVPSADKLTALQRTEDRTRITVRDQRPFVEGPSLGRIESLLGRRVPRYRVVDAPDDGAGVDKAGALGDGTVSFFRPDLVAASRARRGIARPPARQRPPDSSIVPAPRGGSAAGGGGVSGLARGRTAPSDSLRLETYLENERKRMLREQEQERKGAQSDEERAALAARHAREAQAFETWAAQQRKAGPAKGFRGALRPQPRFDRKAAGGGHDDRAPAAGQDSTRAR